MTGPVKPPTLFRINGIGTSVYGKRDRDPKTGTYVKTLVVTFVFIPLFCLGAYRVLDAEEVRSWYFLERVPLSRLAALWNVAVCVAIVVCAQLGRP